MKDPKVEPTVVENIQPPKMDMYGAPIPEDKDSPINMKQAAQANLDRFGLNPDKFVMRPRPNGRET